MVTQTPLLHPLFFFNFLKLIYTLAEHPQCIIIALLHFFRMLNGWYVRNKGNHCSVLSFLVTLHIRYQFSLIELFQPSFTVREGISRCTTAVVCFAFWLTVVPLSHWTFQNQPNFVTILDSLDIFSLPRSPDVCVFSLVPTIAARSFPCFLDNERRAWHVLGTTDNTSPLDESFSWLLH